MKTQSKECKRLSDWYTEMIDEYKTDYNLACAIDQRDIEVPDWMRIGKGKYYVLIDSKYGNAGYLDFSDAPQQ